MKTTKRSLHGWLSWWANSCPWERVMPSPGWEVIGAPPQRRPPSYPDRTCDWITVSILLSRLSPTHRHHILAWVTGRSRRLPHTTLRSLRRELNRRRMLA